MNNCIVIDDEPLAVALLESHISKVDSLNLVGSFTNPLEALAFVQKHVVEVIFVDIQMPQLSGVNFAKVIDSKIAIIFTTAYSEYAVEGFELNALDYLVKPISLARFLQAVHKLSNTDHCRIEEHTEPVEKKADFLFVKTEYRHQKIKNSEILYIKGLSDYAAIYTTNGKILTLENMKSILQRLPSQMFYRVHKSYIISLDKIEFVERNRISIAGELIPIGASYQKSFWALIK